MAKTRDICRLLEIKPARSKGQNFLINDKIYEDIIKAADLSSEDTVLEVGPGLGFLTARLAKKVKRVIAVELDDRLANYLQMAVDANGIDNVTIINEDILRFNLDKHLDPQEKYKIVANLPYNITSIFLRNFLSGSRPPESFLLMLQKEVVNRIIAKPPEMSLLALSVQYHAEARLVRTVKAGNFWPEPEVDSALISLLVKDSSSDKDFFKVARAGFSAKRKMLKNNLAAGLKIESKFMEKIFLQAGLDLKIRAAELSLENWHKLVAALRPFML